MAVNDPISYILLEDLFNFAPDFMDKHRQVITAAVANVRSSNASGMSGSGSFSTKMPKASALRQNMNNDLANMQSNARTSVQENAKR